MKTRRSIFGVLMTVLLTGLFGGCEPQEEPLAYWYPKKQLVEEFVSTKCGYCAMGMEAVHDFVAEDTTFVVIAHHYGYQTDKFSVKGGDVICNQLGVSGTPSASINRAKTNYYRKQSAMVFNPAYLSETKKEQFDDRTYACVDITNTYYPGAREVKIHISGRVSPSENPSLKLNVLIKESGMISSQSDYYNNNGWKEYRHTDAVRAFLTGAKGDEVTITNHRFSADYTCVLDDDWIPENCMVVAFICEDFQPVVNANQKPVVKGTNGGAEFAPEGITLR